MICPRPDCALQFSVNAREEYRRANGIPYSAQSEECAQCFQCSKEGTLVCWERRVTTAKDGTVTVELRRKNLKQENAA